MWHLPQFSKRLELLIKPSGFGYNAYNQAIVVKIPNQIISYLTEYYYISFVDIESNVLCFFSKKFSPGTNEVEYYVRVESVDDTNYTSLFVYYDGVGSVDVCGPREPEEYVFDDAYIINYLSETDLVSVIGPNFSNHSAALHQPICDTYAVKVTGGSTYVSCSISKSSFTLFFNYYLISGPGYFVYFSSDNYVYAYSDGFLVAKINGNEYTVGSKLYFDTCSTFSITCDGENVYIVINGLTKLVIKQTFSISEIRLGGNGSSGYSIEGYFFDLFLLPSKLPLYSYYLHNTIYNNSNFFRESGYDNSMTNGYLTSWPEVIFSGDEAIFKSNICLFDGWKYYRPITITNSGANSLSDQQVLINLSTSVLGNPYNNINPDGSDIRFTSISGCLFSYCIDVWNNTDDSIVVVVVSGIDSVPVGDSIICMYYDKDPSVPVTINMSIDTYQFMIHYDSFDTKDTSYWTFDSYQTVPYDLNGENVLKMWGDDTWRSYYTDEYIVSGMEVTIEFLRTGTSSWHISAFDNSSDRWCIREDNSGNIQVQYRVSGTYYYPKTLISSAKINVWYVALLRADDVNGFYMKVWEKDNPTVYGDYSYQMPAGQFWRFCSWQYQNVIGYHDNYRVYNTVQGHQDISTTVGSGIGIEEIYNVEENIFQQYIKYSTSFDGGNSWYVSNLNYDEMFTKYFGLQQDYNTVLRLSTDTETIDKNYIIKVNDFNKFSINYDVDFSAGLKKDDCLDIVTDFTPALPTILGIDTTPVEYGYEGDLTELKSLYLLRPVEFAWGGAFGSGIISKPVEFCFDTVMDSWFDDVYVDFWLGELEQGYHINMFTDFVVESKNDFYENIEVDFVLSNWKYFPHQSNVICSVMDCNNKNVEISTCSGILMRFMSDVNVSDMLYADFNSSVFCSVSGISPYYLFDVQTTSGTLASYDNDIYCSLLDMNNYNFEVKLNTIVIENFNMGVDDFTIGDFCFSVNVYDKHYGVTISGIDVYMNTDTLVGNAVTGLQFDTISGSGGYSVSWCYDIASLGSLEYVEIIVRAVNTVGDINLASYFLKYGKRYYYNLYHILKHDYEKLIPMLMLAENNVDIFPSFSAESMYVRVERYKRKDLTASIFGVGLDRSDLPANINALTTNFYNGGSYKVRVECKDLSGNIMDPFEFEFIIKNDGT